MLVRRRVLGDRGSSYFQWLALGVLAAVIVAGLTPVVGAAISDGAVRVICRIVHQGATADCTGTQAPNPGKIDINPQWCLSSMHSDGFQNTLSYSVFSIGSGYKVIRYDSREEDFDGKVKHYVYLAFVDSGDAGIDLQKAKNGKQIDVGGGEYVNYGDFYRLTPDEYNRFSKSIKLWQNYMYAESHPWGTSGGGISDHTVYQAYQRMAKDEGLDFPPKIPGPAITFGEHSEQGRAEGKIPFNGDKKLKLPTKYVVPNGGTVATTQAHTVTTEHWYIYKDPNGNILPATATYHTTSGTYTVGVGRSAGKSTKTGSGAKANADAEYTLDYSNTTRVTRDDKTGKLRSIRYVITYGDKGSLNRGVGVNGKDRGKGKKSGGAGLSDTHSDGNLHTEVIQINFALDDDANQQIGENWLKNHGLEMPPEVVNEVFPKTGPVPGIPDDKPDAGPPPANADPFDKLIYDRAMGWKTDAETKDQALRFSATLPYGKGIGFQSELSSQDAKTTKAQILDAPGSDGRRHWIDFPACTAAGNH
ncbi:MAG TPA: hypothetical protein VGL93_00815 [Streptosporangiaceae bacterium]|jgi:hypothetical protein